ncbi:MAG TPA: sulfatase, partial [Thermoanaerobaculia bacterium]|nr:sulfatase [Thermoanaerobaculia bacterium]
MPRLRLLATAAAIAAATSLAGCRGGGDAARFPGAPIILISIDTLRADRLPAYGSKRVATPAIDRLAADGILFENAYAHVPLTLPSHTTLLTGRLPYDNGVRSNIGYRLEGDRARTLPGLLAAQGYATGAAVSAYVLRGETGLGPLFDSYDDSLEVWEAATLGALQRRGDDTVQVALRWVDQVRGGDGARTKPFFLFVHLFEPHSPYEPAPPFRDRYPDAYDGEIATVDAVVGRLFAEL